MRNGKHKEYPKSIYEAFIENGASESLALSCASNLIIPHDYKIQGKVKDTPTLYVNSYIADSITIQDYSIYNFIDIDVSQKYNEPIWFIDRISVNKKLPPEFLETILQYFYEDIDENCEPNSGFTRIWTSTLKSIYDTAQSIRCLFNRLEEDLSHLSFDELVKRFNENSIRYSKKYDRYNAQVNSTLNHCIKHKNKKSHTVNGEKTLEVESRKFGEIKIREVHYLDDGVLNEPGKKQHQLFFCDNALSLNSINQRRNHKTYEELIKFDLHILWGQYIEEAHFDFKEIGNKKCLVVSLDQKYNKAPTAYSHLTQNDKIYFLNKKSSLIQFAYQLDSDKEFDFNKFKTAELNTKEIALARSYIYSQGVSNFISKLFKKERDYDDESTSSYLTFTEEFLQRQYEIALTHLESNRQSERVKIIFFKLLI